MSMLSKVERIDRELFKAGMFTLKSTILTGRKGQNDVKLDAVYNRTYNSQKYSNQSELTTVNISTGDYIVFSYNNFEAKANEEIFISHPNMLDIKWFCNEMLAMVQSNEVFNKNNTVNVKYQEHQINSPGLGGNKVLVAIPTAIQKDQNCIRGVYLFFNSEDKYVELDAKAIFTLNEIVRNIDLLSLSNATLLLGMMANVQSVGEDDNTYTPAPKSPLPNRGSFFSNRGSRFSPRNEAGQQGTSTSNNAPVEETDNAFAESNAPQQNSAPTSGGTRFKKPSGTGLPNRGNTNRPVNGGIAPTTTPNPVTSGEDVMSMANIMNVANDITFEPAGDEDVEF